MTSKNLQTFYGLKWNPFTPDVPVEALCPSAAITSFCRRVQAQLSDGGFALITGDPGTGKSVALRLLSHHLSALPDVTVGVLTRPQSRLGDFYRELGQLFGVSLTPHNRWSSFADLRQKWQAHIDSTLFRPVLLVDEAQELSPPVISEIRILQSSQFDSRSLLSVVLAGDARLTALFSRPEFLPVASRIRTRLVLEPTSPKELLDTLRYSLESAGQPSLMTSGLMNTLAEHAIGNFRVLSIMASELLAVGLDRQLPQLDEKLYLELFTPKAKPRAAARPA